MARRVPPILDATPRCTWHRSRAREATKTQEYTMIDVEKQINAVRRTVGDRTLEAGEARVVTISQSYATDAADLWHACTDIDRIRRWFLPITGDLRVGGHYGSKATPMGRS